jgi:hypothetical protein
LVIFGCSLDSSACFIRVDFGESVMPILTEPKFLHLSPFVCARNRDRTQEPGDELLDDT